MTASKNKKLSFKSLGWMTIINIVAVGVSLAQTIAVAAIFGATRSIEIFFAATTFLMFLQQIASAGQIGDLFTPIFHDLQVSGGNKVARDAFSAMTNTMALVGLVISVLAVIFSTWFANVMVPGFSADDIALCAQVFAVTAPLLLLQIVSGMFSNFLRAEHHYGVEESLSFISRVSNFVILIVFGWRFGLWALIAGLWVSTLIGLIGQTTYAFSKGYRYRFLLATEDFKPKAVLAKVPYAFSHIIFSQFFSFALTRAFSHLDAGPFAIYGYAKRLQVRFQGVLLKPVGVLFFNRFSQELAEGAERVRSLAVHTLALSVALVAISLAVIAPTGDLLLMAVWGGKNFSAEQIDVCHAVLIALIFLLFGSAQYLVSRRTCLALKIVARQFAASGIVMLICGLSCFWLIPTYGIWGAVAVNFIASIGTSLGSLLLLWFVRRDLAVWLPVGKLLAWIFAAGIAIAATTGIRQAIGIQLSDGRWPLLLAAGVLGFFSVSLCIGISWLMGIEETRDTALRIRTRLQSTVFSKPKTTG